MEAVIMDHVENVVRIPIGGGEEPEPSRTSSPPPDLITLAAGAAIGLVALAVEAAVQILQAVSATPDRDGVQGPSETVAMLTGAALGFAIEAARTAAAAAELGRRTAGPPTSFLVGNVFDGPWRAGLDLLSRWNQSWREERPDVEAAANAVAVEAVQRTIDLVLDQLDLTQLVLDHVDLDRVISSVDLDAVVGQLDIDRIAGGIDLDAIADRLDVERVIARLDLAKLSLEVIERIDLPEIIRTSTGTVASEGVRVVRMQTFGADRAISGIVSRMLGRRPPEAPSDLDEPTDQAGPDRTGA